MENLTSLETRGSLLFSWPNSLPPSRAVVVVKAAEPRRHREDSPAGGRSHAIPPSRGPETGSLIDSSNTPHILLPFIKAFSSSRSASFSEKEQKKKGECSVAELAECPCFSSLVKCIT